MLRRRPARPAVPDSDSPGGDGASRIANIHQLFEGFEWSFTDQIDNQATASNVSPSSMEFMRWIHW
jgi:hypothetical protein